MFYPLLRQFIFALDAETAHEATLELLNTFRYLIPGKQVQKPVNVMGLTFPNPVGLAAGMDKNADYLPGLSKLGFGFIEVGTITPLPQPGNPKPRLFRLPEYDSIINRMGFNNKGVDELLSNIDKLSSRNFILGINIGKNLHTSVEHALSDYTSALERVYLHADYITVNISSPNTPGLRDLQSEKALEELLYGITECRKELQDRHQQNRPIALKISPDLDLNAIAPISELLIKYNIDSLIATNTTLDRSAVASHSLSNQAGGLSGEALTEKSRQILFSFYNALQNDIPIISAGGISTTKEAQLRLDIGAKLVQVYSGLVFKGPKLIRDITQNISQSTS